MLLWSKRREPWPISCQHFLLPLAWYRCVAVVSLLLFLNQHSVFLGQIYAIDSRKLSPRDLGASGAVNHETQKALQINLSRRRFVLVARDLLHRPHY